LWVAGGAVKDFNPKKALKALRRYWEIENRLFWVRDVESTWSGDWARIKRDSERSYKPDTGFRVPVCS
jgi:predicted transposase YbfD/YdcC